MSHITKVLRYRGMAIIFRRSPGGYGWSWHAAIRTRQRLTIGVDQQYGTPLCVARRNAISTIDVYLDSRASKA